MGDNPECSVVDGNGQAHDADNLFVIALNNLNQIQNSSQTAIPT